MDGWKDEGREAVAVSSFGGYVFVRELIVRASGDGDGDVQAGELMRTGQY